MGLSLTWTCFCSRLYGINRLQSCTVFHPIPTSMCHVIYGLIQPIASGNRVKSFCKYGFDSSGNKSSILPLKQWIKSSELVGWAAGSAWSTTIDCCITLLCRICIEMVYETQSKSIFPTNNIFAV